MERNEKTRKRNANEKPIQYLSFTYIIHGWGGDECVLFRFMLWQHSNCRRQPRTPIRIRIQILAAARSQGEICMSESNATVLTACRAHYLHTDDRNDAGDEYEYGYGYEYECESGYGSGVLT